MIAILSPAMRMHTMGELPQTEPQFLREAELLHQQLCALLPHQLESALCVNSELALRAFADMQVFSRQKQAVAAAFGYHGLCYRALGPASFSADERQFMQEHLRIVSAFYGLLRPFDNMQPYRLEMQTIGVPNYPDLYEFWGEKLCRALFRDTNCVLSLCSREYEKAILPYVSPEERAIRCEFLIPDKGKLLMKPTQVKAARGRMARYIIKNRIDDPQALMAFGEDGYCFAPYRSTPKLFVFTKSPYVG